MKSKKRTNTVISTNADLAFRKSVSRTYLRSLSALEKVTKLAQLQEQFYQFLSIREQNGGKAVPENWRKWYKARKSYSDSVQNSGNVF